MSSTGSRSDVKIFISYAREDEQHARWLYQALKDRGYEPWLDKVNILPGEKWKDRIATAIRGSSAFVAVISRTSVAKRGFVQREWKFALDVLEELPANQVFVIPARVDDVVPQDPALRELSWVDLMDDRDGGLERIAESIEAIRAIDLSIAKEAARVEQPTFDAEVVTFLSKLPKSTADFDTDVPVYISFSTQSPGVVMPQDLRDRYPGEMTVILQHQFKDLEVDDERLNVTLWFSGRETRLAVPVEAVSTVSQGEVVLHRH